MKNKVLLIFFIFFSFSNLSSEEVAKITWEKEYNEAKSIAKKKNLPLLLFFSGSDWCPWCKKMKKDIFENPGFIEEVGDSFVFCVIDFSLTKKDEKDALKDSLVKEYGVEGFPMVVLVDVNKGMISKVGYLPVDGREYALHLKELVKDYYQVEKTFKQSSSLSEKQWEQLDQTVKALGCPYYLQKVEKEGLEKCMGPYFLLEKYESALKNNGFSDPNSKVLREKIKQKDPHNVYGSHFRLAVLEFKILSKELSTDPKKVVEPLVQYISIFGDKDKKDLWKIHLLIAEYLFSKKESKAALYHAKLSFQNAPEIVRKDLAETIGYLRAHSQD